MALRQLGSRLAPSLLQTSGGLKELSCSLHSSAVAQGVGIPERKHDKELAGLHEGASMPHPSPSHCTQPSPTCCYHLLVVCQSLAPARAPPAAPARRPAALGRRPERQGVCHVAARGAQGPGGRAGRERQHAVPHRALARPGPHPEGLLRAPRDGEGAGGSEGGSEGPVGASEAHRHTTRISFPTPCLVPRSALLLTRLPLTPRRSTIHSRRAR